MTLATILRLFTLPDLAAIAFLMVAWLAIGWAVEHPPTRRPSVAVLMTAHRREWMVNYVTRAPRITDATLLGNLREGTAFFASACLIALGGGLALMGNTERLNDVAREFMVSPEPAMVWEIKILPPLLLITNAFLKFVWSHRVFGYCSVMMGAVPNDPDHPAAMKRARVAAELNIEAAKAFNRGMRAVYFALGSLGWLLGPELLGLGAAVAAGTIIHREFLSASRRVLMGADPKRDPETPS